MRPERRLEEYLSKLRQQLPDLETRFGVRSLGIFGSHMRNEDRQGSDLDLLVSFERTPGLLSFLALENHLTDLLGVQVDLVMEESLKPGIGERILRERVSV
jgi:predicted nucleotidyltransferase